MSGAEAVPRRRRGADVVAACHEQLEEAVVERPAAPIDDVQGVLTFRAGRVAVAGAEAPSLVGPAVKLGLARHHAGPAVRRLGDLVTDGEARLSGLVGASRCGRDDGT